MTSRYILDENVVIFAQNGRDENDNPDRVCADLVEEIVDGPFLTLVVDDLLWGKYVEQLYHPTYHDAELGPHLMIRLWDVLQIPGKIDGLGHTAPTFPEEVDIPPGSQDDKFIVRLAVEESEKDTTLVTTDQPLRRDLSNCGIQARYNLNVLSPEGALAGL
jgi:hypothetical protein